MSDHPQPGDAPAPAPGPDAPEPLDWESPRWQEGGKDQQSDVEFERRYRNASASPYGGAIDTPGAEDRPGNQETRPGNPAGSDVVSESP